MLESSGVFSSPMLPIFSWELKIITYRTSFTIPSSSKMALLRQCEMTSRYYIVTLILYYLCGSEIRLWFVFFLFFFCVCFFFNVSLPKRLKFNHVDIYIFKVKKKSTRTRCEKSPKLIIKVPKRR